MNVLGGEGGVMQELLNSVKSDEKQLKLKFWRLIL